MTVGPVHFQGVTMRETGRVIWRWFFTANPKWIFGVKVENFALGHIDLRNPVVGSW